MAMAAANAEVSSAEVGGELAAAYERIRQEAKALHTRAEWGDDASFDRVVPPVSEEPVQVTHAMAMPYGGPAAYKDVVRGRRARVLLGQLAAWAEGHQQAFELEERFKSEAEAKAKAAQPRPKTGF